MTASFLLFAILIGVVGRMSESSFTSTFVDGARDLLGVALIIGIARGITVVMNNGLITDTVLNWAELAVADLGGVAFINLMYVMFLPLSFLIPSSSGLATVAMPIMAPARELRGRAGAARRDRLPERERPREPRHADVGRGDGRPGHRPRRLRHLAEVRVAGPVLLAILTVVVLTVHALRHPVTDSRPASAVALDDREGIRSMTEQP